MMASPEFYVLKVDRIYKVVARFLGLNMKAVTNHRTRVRRSNQQFRKINGSSLKNKLKLSSRE